MQKQKGTVDSDEPLAGTAAGKEEDEDEYTWERLFEKKEDESEGEEVVSSRRQKVSSKRFVALKEQVDGNKIYEAAEGVALLRKLATAKFVETAELHAKLNLDPKYNDQQIRTTVALPHGTGKSIKVAVLAEGPMADAAREAGADIVGMDDLVAQISEGDMDFDILLATPPAMPKVAKLGKVLGPKGLMPSPKAGTVTSNPAETVKEFKAGKQEFRTDKEGNIHVPFGKADFTEEQLLENLMALSDCVETNRPTGCKGKLWKSSVITSTMGPGIKLNPDELRGKIKVETVR